MHFRFLFSDPRSLSIFQSALYLSCSVLNNDVFDCEPFQNIETNSSFPINLPHTFQYTGGGYYTQNVRVRLNKTEQTIVYNIDFD